MTGLKYVLKVWVTTIIAAPVILILLQSISGASSEPFDAGFFLSIILYSAGLSMPTLFVTVLLTTFVFQHIESRLKFKLFVILVSLVGMALTFYLFYEGKHWNLHSFSGGAGVIKIFAACILFFGLLFRVNHQSKLTRIDRRPPRTENS